MSPKQESRIADSQEVTEDQFEKSIEEALAICKLQMNNSNDVKAKKNRVNDRGLSKGGRKITKVRCCSFDLYNLGKQLTIFTAASWF